MMSQKVRIIDTTMRDGSHALHHTQSPETVSNICACLERAGVYAAEVGHGAGLNGSLLQYGFGKYSDEALLTAARAQLHHTKLYDLFCPGIATMKDMRYAKEHYGLDGVRVAVHCSEADLGETHIQGGKELGLDVICFLMMCHLISIDELVENAMKAKSYGADVIYFADSAGAFTPQDIRDRVVALKQATGLPIGVHTNNNLGLGVGNVVAAVEAGADYVDGALNGLGAGSGNGCTQAIAAVLEKMHVDTGCDFYALCEAADKYVVPIMQRPLQVTSESCTLGKVGIYSSFYLNTLEASQKYGIPYQRIFEELGRRGAIGGQEDMILDICQAFMAEGKQDLEGQ